jgi:predicted O-methyltransferase YrrM
MSVGGTASYLDQPGLPPLVAKAVQSARLTDFDNSSRIEQGRLLSVLAGGASASIGETGTGTGVGLAWLVSGRGPRVRVVSVELDERRAALASTVFEGTPDVSVIHGDWTKIYDLGPFDLLVVDGGGGGKNGSPPADVRRLLNPGGSIVIDDFTPMTEWPPMHNDRPDEARLAWLTHPDLISTEIRLAPDLSAIIGTRKPPADPRAPVLHRCPSMGTRVTPVPFGRGGGGG